MARAHLGGSRAADRNGLFAYALANTTQGPHDTYTILGAFLAVYVGISIFVIVGTSIFIVLHFNPLIPAITIPAIIFVLFVIWTERGRRIRRRQRQDDA